jgi:hypothetical protein
MEALHDVIEETVDPDFVNHSAATFEDTRGQDGVKNVFGSFRAEFVGLAPTGQRVEVTGINIDRITNGRFVERWYEMDRLGLMGQLGAAPDRGQGE